MGEEAPEATAPRGAPQQHTNRAVIIGGGLGGVAAAVGLHRTGWHVTVLERAPEFGEIGAGITLMPNALRALDQLGLGAEARAAGGLTRGTGGVRTPSGRWLTRVNVVVSTQEAAVSFAVFHRTELHRLLRSVLPEGALLTGASVTRVTRSGDLLHPARITYSTPTLSTSLDADLVVGADGIDSRIRAQLWPGHPEPAYSGSTAWRAVTAAAVPNVAPSQTWGPGTEFGVLPLPDGRTYWYAACNDSPGREYDDELAEVHRRVRTWHSPIPQLLDATPTDAVLHHDIRELADPLPTYVCGRVALLGDAAHAMTPYLGQGACQAIEDAAVLAAVVGSDTRDVPEALTHYDAHRRPRTQAVARAARTAGRLGQQLQHPLAVGLRNTLVRLMPARIGLRPVMQFIDWKPPSVQESGGNETRKQ